MIALALAACGGPVKVRPDVWCPNDGLRLRPAPEVTLSERVAGALDDCGPMARVIFEAAIARTP